VEFTQNTGPGTPPNEIVAIPMLHQEINVEWTSPDEPNGRITEYIIHYGEVPAGDFIKLKDQSTVDAM
jgi:hypothetical protein